MTLTTIWLVPLIGGALVAFLPPRLAKSFGALVALVALSITAFVAANFAPDYHGFQFTERVPCSSPWSRSSRHRLKSGRADLSA